MGYHRKSIKTVFIIPKNNQKNTTGVMFFCVLIRGARLRRGERWFWWWEFIGGVVA